VGGGGGGDSLPPWNLTIEASPSTKANNAKIELKHYLGA